jgi:hypothetical protein
MPKQEEVLFDHQKRTHGDRIKTWQEIEAEKTPQAESEPDVRDVEPSDEERIGRLINPLTLTTQTGEGVSTRNEFVLHHHWVPYHQSEVTITNRGLKKHLDIVGKAKQGNRAAALNKVLNEVDKYRAEASQTGEALREIIVDENAGDEHQLTRPDPGVIKRNEYVRGALTDFMLAKESLDRFKWYPAGKNRQLTKANSERLKDLDSLIDRMPEEQLVQLWQTADASSYARARFWADQHNQLNEAKDTNYLAAQSTL